MKSFGAEFTTTMSPREIDDVFKQAAESTSYTGFAGRWLEKANKKAGGQRNEFFTPREEAGYHGDDEAPIFTIGYEQIHREGAANPEIHHAVHMYVYEQDGVRRVELIQPGAKKPTPVWKKFARAFLATGTTTGLTENG